MKIVKPLISAALALALLAAPALTAFANAIDIIPMPDKWTIPYYVTPVVINANKNNVTLDPSWGQKQFTVNQKMLTQGDPTIQDMFGGSKKSDGWGNLWTNYRYTDDYNALDDVDQTYISTTGQSIIPPDTPFDVWMGWETGYFDFAVLVPNHTNYNPAEGNADFWQYDCLQLQIGSSVNGTRYEYGIARGTGLSSINLSYEWFPDDKEAPLAQATEYAVNTKGDTTLYQMKIPLAKFGMDSAQWQQKGAFPFAFSLHIYDPNDTTGQTTKGYFMEWASGVVGGTTEKTLSTAATITLGDTIPPQYQVHWFGDINYDGVVNTSDARMILQSIVGKLQLSDAQKALADVNKDSKIDTADARIVLQVIVGKLAPLGKV